jgi:hypothetical protein
MRGVAGALWRDGLVGSSRPRRVRRRSFGTKGSRSSPLQKKLLLQRNAGGVARGLWRDGSDGLHVLAELGEGAVVAERDEKWMVTEADVVCVHAGRHHTRGGMRMIIRSEPASVELFPFAGGHS